MKRRYLNQRFATGLAVPALGLVLPLGALAADAATPYDKRADTRFESLWRQLDVNNDGAVSRNEFNAFHREPVVGAPRGSSMSSRGLERAVSANRFIGTEIRNRQGEELGEVQDLLVDVRSGKIEGVIVSYGGIGNLFDKLFHYPLSSFSRGMSGELVLDVDTDKLDAAQGFDRDNWPFAEASRSAGALALWRATRLIGKDVEDRNGEHLGEISDLVIDAGKGQVAHTLLRYDRAWSLDNPLVALPLDSFRFGGPRQDVSMDVDKERIDAQRLAEMGQAQSDRGTVVVERWLVLVPDRQPTADASDTRSGSSTSQDAQPSARAAPAADQQPSGGQSSSTNKGDAAMAAPAK